MTAVLTSAPDEETPELAGKESAKLLTPEIAKAAIVDSLKKFHPRVQAKNPVMFVVLIGSVLTTVLFIKDAGSSTVQENVFSGVTALFLWFTVLFANFAEAVAEGRGKAQADTLRKTRSETSARKRLPNGSIEVVSSSLLDLNRPVAAVKSALAPDHEVDFLAWMTAEFRLLVAHWDTDVPSGKRQRRGDVAFEHDAHRAPIRLRSLPGQARIDMPDVIHGFSPTEAC